ncbi:MAG: phosphatidylcholine/phosphatidylserine synthase [Chlamydiales bacterium]|nr:phosphatidylcholine/phosphatidylserine synthase [Chlamydiales bacterium]
MRKVYLIPNLVTAFGLACGLFVIFRMNMIEPGTSTYSLLYMSAILLLIAGVADVLDGAIARFIHAESEFGCQFDSLSDAITFGVAPTVTILKTLSAPQGSELSFFAMTGALIYSVCGVLRLVRFNVKSLESKKNELLQKTHNKHFTGLPITVAAIAAISMNLFLVSDDFERWFSLSSDTKTIVLIATMVVLGYFMVSRWKFPSAKALHFRVKSIHLVFITVLMAVLLLYGVFYHFALLFMAVSWIYIIVAWSLSIARVIAGKKSKTLEDFEPEPDDLDDF